MPFMEQLSEFLQLHNAPPVWVICFFGFLLFKHVTVKKEK